MYALLDKTRDLISPDHGPTSATYAALLALVVIATVSALALIGQTAQYL